jgi:hypothetical protein
MGGLLTVFTQIRITNLLQILQIQSSRTITLKPFIRLNYIRNICN